MAQCPGDYEAGSETHSELCDRPESRNLSEPHSPHPRSAADNSTCLPAVVKIQRADKAGARGAARQSAEFTIAVGCVLDPGKHAYTL